METGTQNHLQTIGTERKVVEPADIERELMRVWKTMAAEDRAQEASESASAQAAPRVRTTLSNTVICIPTASSNVTRNQVDTLITELCSAYPSRFFIIYYDRDATETTLQSEVSSRCVIAKSGSHVCSEEVYLRCGPKGAAVVPNLLTSLFVPDVHSILIVLGDPVQEIVGVQGGENFERMIQVVGSACERLIYDSGLFADYGKTVSYLANIATYTRDINWNRTKRWQMLIAEHFDADRFQRAVSEIAGIKLYCSSTSSSILNGNIPGDALLLTGWILSSLDWKAVQCSKLKAKASLVLSCTSGSGSTPTVSIFGSDEVVQNDFIGTALQEVRFVLKLEGKSSELIFKRNRDGDFCEMWLESEGEKRSMHDDGTARRSLFKMASLESIIEKNIRSDAWKSEFGSVLKHSLGIASKAK